jgi:hypothetical protein
VGGLLAVALWGAFVAFVVLAALRRNGLDSPVGLLAPYVLLIPILAPMLDVVSPSVLQSLAIWIGIAVFIEVGFSLVSKYRGSGFVTR